MLIAMAHDVLVVEDTVGDDVVVEVREVLQRRRLLPRPRRPRESIDVHLPALDEAQTYQLWGQQGETKVSLAVLGNAPEQSVLPLGGEYEALAITAEQSPGVVSSSNPAVVAGLVTD